MQLHKPDPEYLSSPRAARNFGLALRLALATTGVIWFIWLSDAYLDLGLARYGLRPRDAEGLLGIVTAPLLHADLEHIFSNTLPLIVSLTAMLYLYPNSSVRALPMLWLGTGLLAWCIGRPSVHIGASGFIYGMLTFVFLGGVFRQDMRSVGVSLMVWFLYGSMVWGVLPIKANSSWEMHLAGAILGVVMALLYRDWDRVPVKRYEWEDDDTVPDWFPEEFHGPVEEDGKGLDLDGEEAGRRPRR
jgi:membrane associated rhomboid family serine protease